MSVTMTSCVFDIGNFRNAWFIPDIHGDLKALTLSLCATSCVDIPESVLHAATYCPDSARADDRGGTHLSVQQVQSIRWIGDNDIIFVLGDVLDNRRRVQDDPYGVCGLEGTQYQILAIMQHLQDAARSAGGDLVWILGNHDYENAVPPPYSSSSFCRAMAPLHLCDGFGYTQDHRERVTRAMQNMSACAVATLRHGRNALMIAHGGLNKDVISALQAGARAGVLTWQAGVLDDNLYEINAIYARALYDHCETCLQFLKDNASTLPHWCRTKNLSLDDLRALREAFDGRLTYSLVKSHDVQISNGRPDPKCKHADGSTTRASDGVAAIGDGTICMLDSAMSRAFRPFLSDIHRRYVTMRVRPTESAFDCTIIARQD